MIRIDSNKTRLVQHPVYPNRFLIEHLGLQGTVEQWANHLKISKVTLYGRIRTMPLKKALTHGGLNQAQHNPKTHTRKTAANYLSSIKAPNPKDEGKWFMVDEKPAFRYKGSIRTISAWANKLDIPTQTLKSRLLTQKKPIHVAVAKTINHGTVAAYSSLGCRCEICKAHNAKRQREYQASKRQK